MSPSPSFLKSVWGEALLYVCNHVVAAIPSHWLRLSFYRHVMEFEIGPSTYVFLHAWFDCKRGLRIGRNSVINQKCRLDPRGGIEIGDQVSISAEVCILTADHDPQSPDFAGRHGPVRIEDYAFIGTRATILRGVTVGQGAVVAAGAVVVRSVEPYTIVAGCPAKAIGTRSRDLRYAGSYGRWFH